MDLTATWIMTIRAELGPTEVVGQTLSGVTRIISIKGGTVEGPNWEGRISPGGADWNTSLRNERTEFLARYQIVAEDGTVISVTNEGVAPNDLERSVIKTKLTFLVDVDSAHAHLLDGIHVGTLDVSEIGQGWVQVGVYRLP